LPYKKIEKNYFINTIPTLLNFIIIKTWYSKKINMIWANWLTAY